ncbi:MAG: outer membrane beta-barrel protein [Gemmatimonadota bacterium]
MRDRRGIVLSLLVAAVAVPASPARAQNWVHLTVNPYVGALVFDDSELNDAGLEVNIGAMGGARVGVALGDDWQFEASYGFARLALEASEFETDADGEEQNFNAQLYTGNVNYLIGSDQAPTRLLLSVGAGFMALDPEVGESETDPLASLGAGFTHPIREGILFRGDVKDQMLFCSAPASGSDGSVCLEDQLLHNIEVTAGLEFVFF